MDFAKIAPPRGGLMRPTLFDDQGEVLELPSAWLRSLVVSPKNYSPKTIETYANNLKYFCEYLVGIKSWGVVSVEVSLASISSLGIERYLRYLQGLGLSDATVRNREATLREFFSWLTTESAGRIREASGWLGRYMTRSPLRKMPRFVTKSQFLQLALALNHESQRCVLQFIYESGLRVSEVVRVTKQDIELLKDYGEELEYLPLLVRGSKGRSKGQIKERYVLISRAVVSRIHRYHNSPTYRFARGGKQEYAFLSTKGFPITPKSIQKMIADASIRAGFPSGVISCHRLRHGTALSILQGEWGQDYIEKIVLIQTQFGHASIKSTEQYTHLPAAMFSKMKEGKLKTRFEDAQDIYIRTYLPPKRFVDKRGRPKKTVAQS